jgi:AraC family transcriptional regulator, positive regulator of tynA and feaB
MDMPVRQRWTTSDAEPHQAVTYWSDTICRSLLQIDVPTTLHDRFNARLERVPLGPATLQMLEADAQVIRRTPACIARNSYNGYLLLSLREGEMRFSQFGRESDLEDGDSMLVAYNTPYICEFLSRVRGIGISIPGEWLRNWIPEPSRIAGQPLRARSGWSKALSAALASLDADGVEDLALPGGVVAEQIAALLALAAGSDARATSASERILGRIRSATRDSCHEIGLTPGSIAEANGISKRYLHHLFAQSGSTFGGELMRMRLECAHRLLSDIRYSALSVSEVAARSGFQEPSHFARRFRKEYGAGPLEFRRARLHN